MIPAQTAELLIKHLPPSASTLRLLDLSGRVGEALAARRADIRVVVGTLFAENSFDAILVYDAPLEPARLPSLLRALRPGGRFIQLDPHGDASPALVEMLEAAGYTRILVEELQPGGVLMRGEKPHVTADTLERIQSVAQQDSASAFKGRYLHLLVRQSPNKPVWALKPGETVQWHALALADGETRQLLAFSSLPNAVAFMQPAVLAGSIRDVNKVAKFSRATAAAQNWRLLVNPSLDALSSGDIILLPIDPALAESPDE